MKSLTLLSGLLLLLGCSQKPTPSQASATDKPLDVLVAGNDRFQHSKSLHPHASHQRLLELSKAQHPMAVVVCCSDSRVPPELVFDQGLGDLFVVRTAGNVLSDIELGSIEYAVEHLHTPLIVVLGHEECGAIKATLGEEKPTGHLGTLVSHLKSEPEIQQVAANAPDRVNRLVQANISHAVHQLTAEPVISEYIKSGKVQVAGAEYFLHDGAVQFLGRL
jgi:carbonic anhydrase